ncbi:MAG: hypothetical protein IPK98_10585 [Chloracidobacterium sp.]|nr:hypothetical protein [Chloracidobacterium sp.]
MRAADKSSASSALMNTVADSKRIMALIVIFIIVIVFWMVFHQNGSTLTYWADDNTDWNVTGTIANSINAFWVLTLTFPDGKTTIFGVKFAKKTDEATKADTTGEQQLVAAINAVAPGEGDKNKAALVQNAYLFRVSPFWLILAYAIVTLGRTDAVADGAFARVEGRSDQQTRPAHGRMVRCDSDRQQADNDRYLLGYLAAVQFLPASRMYGLGNGGGPILILKPLKKAMPGV